MDMFKNLQNLQSRMGDMQGRMQEISVTGSAGGDMVRIEMNGQMDVLSVTISPEAVDPDDVGMLQDLVLAACSDASTKVKEKLREEFSSLAGGLELPPGLMGL